MKKWEAEEIRFLHNSVGRVPAGLVAEYLGRSLNSVYGKYQKLGLEGMPKSFAVNSRHGQNPFSVGPRILIAKSCKSCGRLLPARRYTRSASGRWDSDCKSCHYGRYKEYSSPSDERAKRRELQKKKQTQSVSSRTGCRWVDSELEVLKDTNKNLYQVAFEVSRSYSAVSAKATKLKIQRSFNPDQGKMWVVSLSASAVENAPAILQDIDPAGIPTESDWEWSD